MEISPPPSIAMEREQDGGKRRAGRGDIFRQILPPRAEDEESGGALSIISYEHRAGQLVRGDASAKLLSWCQGPPSQLLISWWSWHGAMCYCTCLINPN